MTQHLTEDHVSRRTFAGLAAAGVSLPLLAACGSKDATATDPSTSSSDSSSSGTSPSSGTSSSSGGGGANTLAAKSDIPEGGGKIFADQQVVVTQPTAGQFKAFNTTCTHQGCQVNSVEGGTINCPCHGSKYSIADGSVKAGPAPSPLATVDITVSGDEIDLA